MGVPVWEYQIEIPGSWFIWSTLFLIYLAVDCFKYQHIDTNRVWEYQLEIPVSWFIWNILILIYQGLDCFMYLQPTNRVWEYQIEIPASWLIWYTYFFIYHGVDCFLFKHHMDDTNDKGIVYKYPLTSDRWPSNKEAIRLGKMLDVAK